MKCDKMSRIFACLFLISVCEGLNLKKLASPPHCTHISKDTDYVSRFKFNYPISYIIPGQHEAYQKLFCINPPEVNKAVGIVCDWAAPPQVQFTLGDDFMHVVRQDPTGRFLGNAVITTFQYCSHKITHLDAKLHNVTIVEKGN